MVSQAAHRQGSLLSHRHAWLLRSDFSFTAKLPFLKDDKGTLDLENGKREAISNTGHTPEVGVPRVASTLVRVLVLSVGHTDMTVCSFSLRNLKVSCFLCYYQC